MCYNPYIRYFNYDINDFVIRPFVPILTTLKKIGTKVRNLEKRIDYMFPNHQLISCGQCLECKKRRSNEWTSRLLMEFESKSNVGMMLTLTYDDSKLNCYNDLHANPFRGISLVKRDIQNFIKRLRKFISKDSPGTKIKYYACGEYGSKTNRPHYHVVILGYEFSDRRTSYLVKSHKNFPLYVSDSLSELWKYGLCTISNISSSSLQYVSKYIQKRQYGMFADLKYKNVLVHHNVVNHRNQVYNLLIPNIIPNIVPEFSCMSLKTPIGYEYMRLHYKDLLSKFKFCIDKFKHTFVSLPRYFSRVLEQISDSLLESFKVRLQLYIDKINRYTVDYLYRKKCANEYFKLRFDYSPI